MKKTLPILIFFLVLISVSPSQAHRGRVDLFGCHKNRSTKTYICHKGPFSGQIFTSKAEMLEALKGGHDAKKSFTGKVVGVIDGDTIAVRVAGIINEVHLAEIDCPERGQPFGKEAMQLTSDLLMRAGLVVTVKVKGNDRFGGILGALIFPNGSSLNQELVKAGAAWWVKKYSDDSALGEFEEIARAFRVGLWQDKNPEPPWEFRKRMREAGSEKPDPQEEVPLEE